VRPQHKGKSLWPKTTPYTPPGDFHSSPSVASLPFYPHYRSLATFAFSLLPVFPSHSFLFHHSIPSLSLLFPAIGASFVLPSLLIPPPLTHSPPPLISPSHLRNLTFNRLTFSVYSGLCSLSSPEFLSHTPSFIFRPSPLLPISVSGTLITGISPPPLHSSLPVLKESVLFAGAPRLRGPST